MTIPGLQTKEAQEAYKQAMRAAELNPADFLTLGRRMKVLEGLDKGLLIQFMKNAPIGSRKARYLLAVIKRFEGIGVSDDKLRKVGWTKLVILEPYIDRINAYDYLDKAKGKNAKQLNAFLKNKKELFDTTAVTLYFDSVQRPKFDSIIEKFGAIPQPGGGHSNREAALMKALDIASYGHMS